MVWKSCKTKVKFVSDIPLSIVLFYMTQPADSLPLCLGPLPSIRLGPTLMQSEAERWWAWELRSHEVNVSGTSASQGATTIPYPGAQLLRARCLSCLRREPPVASTLASKTLLLLLLSRMALPFSAAHIPWMGGGRERDPVERNGCGCYDGNPTPGKVGQGTV